MGGDDGRPVDAEAVLAEAAKAFWVMAGTLAVIWVVQIINWADGYHPSVQRPRRLAEPPPMAP